MTTQFDITLYESEALFDDLRGEWNDLLADSLADQVFLTHEWQSIWWQTYHPGLLWTIVFRDRHTRELIGIAPWFRATDPNEACVVRPIGCVDVTDYLEVVARVGHERAVYRALAGWLGEHTGDFDLIQLCNIPGDSLALEAMSGAMDDAGFAVTTTVEDVCPVLTLPEQWTDYFGLLDKKNRHEVRRKLRRAASLTDWYIVGAEHDLDDELQRFLNLMAASNAEKAEFLQDKANRTFFKHLVPAMQAAGWLQLAFLTVNGEAAATYLNLVYQGRVMVYNSGHDAEEHGHLSPGIVLLARLIEYAIEQGWRIFDFLRGDEPYKYDMGGVDTTVHRMVIRRTEEDT